MREHPRISVSKALDAAKESLKKLKVKTWVQIKDEVGMLKIESDEEALKDKSYLDGCYVTKTDMKENEADTYLVYDRYKDLTEVEKMFSGVQDGESCSSSRVREKGGEYARACVCGNACVHDNPKAAQGLDEF